MDIISATLMIILVAVSPGPDFALVTRNALNHSSKAGFYTALGITASIFYHISYSLLGLSLLISQSDFLFDTIKYLGACYLIYLGLSGLLKSSKKDSKVKNQQKSDSNNEKKQFTYFKQGLLCNALNPKTTLFFISFFSILLEPNTVLYIKIFYGLEIALAHFIWFSMLAVFIGNKRFRERVKHWLAYINKAISGLFIYFGLKLIQIV